jgi:hypothetical protein
MLTLDGVTKEQSSNGTIIVSGGNVTAKSKFNITLKDYNIGGSLIGKKIASQVAITVHFRYE